MEKKSQHPDLNPIDLGIDVSMNES